MKMNVLDKNQVIEILKSHSTQVRGAYYNFDAEEARGRQYGAAFKDAKQRNEGYSKVSLEVFYKHSEPKVVLPNAPIKAADPFNESIPDEGPIEHKSCKDCGHSGVLVVYLECPSHGRFT